MTRVLLSLVLVSLSLAPMVAAEEPSEPALSPVVREILSLLEEDVSDEVILTWYQTVAGGGSENRRAFASAEVIALSRGGASDELLQKLIAQGLPREALETEATPGTPATSSAPEDGGGRLQARPSEAPRMSRPPVPRPAQPTTAPGRSSVRVWTIYKPKFEEDEDPWDLYVYLDGELLTGLPGSGPGREPRALQLELSPGRHHLLAVQERHEARKRDPDGWHHQARLWPQTLPFSVEAGRSYEVALRFQQPHLSFRPTGALTLQVLEGGRLVSEQKESGPPPEDWQRLCEEVEANLNEDGSGPLSQRLQLKGCVRWREAWPAEVEDRPSRQELREELAGIGFEAEKAGHSR